MVWCMYVLGEAWQHGHRASLIPLAPATAGFWSNDENTTPPTGLDSLVSRPHAVGQEVASIRCEGLCAVAARFSPIAATVRFGRTGSGTRERLIMTNHTHNNTPSHHHQPTSSSTSTDPALPPPTEHLTHTPHTQNSSTHVMCTHTPVLTYFQSPGKNEDSSLSPCQGP